LNIKENIKEYIYSLNILAVRDYLNKIIRIINDTRRIIIFTISDRSAITGANVVVEIEIYI